MTDEITFMDLASLLKITPNTPLEKLGSALNASIFDASNIAGTLKQKGLIEFTANYPGPNSITITDAGKSLIKEADDKSTMPSDALDESILVQLSGGKRLPTELQNTLNIRPRDLAMRLYKLNKQSLMIYELKNGGVELLLTEQGFLRTKVAHQMPSMMPGPMPKAQPMQQASMPGASMQPPSPAMQAPGSANPGMAGMGKPGVQPKAPTTQGMHSQGAGMGMAMPIIAIVVIIIVVVALYYMGII
jgi:DNA-binding MarR family transcriptional regulator